MKRWALAFLVGLVTLGCPGHLPGTLAPVSDVLGVLCTARPPLIRAHEALQDGDVVTTLAVLRAYLRAAMTPRSRRCSL